MTRVRTPLGFGQSRLTQRPTPPRMWALRPPSKGTSRPPPRPGSRKWSTAYVLRLALFDMFVGAMAVAIPSLNSTRLGTQEPLIVTLSLLGAIVWPATVAGARG